MRLLVATLLTLVAPPIRTDVSQFSILTTALRHTLSLCANKGPNYHAYALSLTNLHRRTGEAPASLIKELRALGYNVVGWSEANEAKCIWVNADPPKRNPGRRATVSVWIHGIALSRTRGLMESADLRLAENDGGWKVAGTSHGWNTWTHPRK